MGVWSTREIKKTSSSKKNIDFVVYSSGDDVLITTTDIEITALKEWFGVDATAETIRQWERNGVDYDYDEDWSGRDINEYDRSEYSESALLVRWPTGFNIG